MDIRRIPPAGDPFTVEMPRNTKCVGCRQRFSRGELVTVYEGHHDNLVFFDGDRVCRLCARRSGVEF
jgi:hypothetical protein